MKISVFLRFFFMLPIFLLYTSYAFSDPQSLITQCAAFNNYGLNQAQNYLAKVVGCWVSTSVSGPGLILPSTGQSTSPIQAYWIFDQKGNQYSCVSSSNMAWVNYTGMNLNNLFGSQGQILSSDNFSYNTNTDTIAITDKNYTIYPNVSANPATMTINFRRMDTNNDADKSILGRMIFPNIDPYYSQIVTQVNAIGNIEITDNDYHNTFTACASTQYPSN